MNRTFNCPERRKNLLPLLFITAVFSLSSVLPTWAQSAAHRHDGARETNIPEIEVVEDKPNVKAEHGQFARRGNYESFSAYEEEKGYRIFFTDRLTKKNYEIRGVGLQWRPFSDLRWKNTRVLLFDCWANPNHGTHYEFDAKERKLKKVLIFREDDEKND